eukprot:maker-scaffold769_size100554-snap-gene-0.18 protein:Tk04818 transcript:maker-scaffold769_size100554-snap-gene-0.18-mRNA-1 annotation:"lysosomal alpha-mannosidase (mannosidase alpha class 2b member 1)"
MDQGPRDPRDRGRPIGLVEAFLKTSSLFTLRRSGISLPATITQLRLEVHFFHPIFSLLHRRLGAGQARDRRISGAFNVHLVPHSHDDVGWLKTLDEYFYGEKNDIQPADVQEIIDTVIPALRENPSRRFIQVETAFFWMWWEIQNDTTKAFVHELVDEGRLEFVGSGWSMNDEAATHYASIIENMAVGFKELSAEFGMCGVPRVAWQIDPFGHSKEQANLFAQMGYDGLFFARIDYRDKAQRRAKKELEMIWRASADDSASDEKSSIFTGVFAGHYSAPRGFCFGTRPWCQDPGFTPSTQDAKIETFLGLVSDARAHYKSENHLMFTMGDDFTYEEAGPFYSEMDTLIALANQRTNETGVHLLYSTPSCYIKSLNDEQEVQWPEKNDDFFPYASGENSYWSGYFTSRPTFKFHERKASILLQSAKQTLATSKSVGLDQQVRNLQREVGVAQHHDAITGTAKQLVDLDYHKRLSLGEQSAQQFMAKELFQGMDMVLDDPNGDYVCPQLNISECHIVEQEEKLIFMVYNPQASASNVNVRIPVVDDTKFQVYDANGSPLDIEFVDIPENVLNIPGRTGMANYEALFEVEDVPPLGYKTFLMDQTQVKRAKSEMNSRLISETEFYSLLPGNLKIDIKYYLAWQGSGQASGAYIFRPDSTEPIGADIQDITEVVRDQMTEWRVQTTWDWASFVIRKYENRAEYEVEWLVGPIPVVANDLGREVIMVYSDPALDSEDTFWTDANGRQFVPRVRNARSSYDFVDGDKEPVSSNYYPVTTGIFVKNQTDALTVLNDRSQGGSSLKAGEVELMVHRRLLRDDGFGVGAALDEMFEGKPLVVRGKHFLNLGPSADQWDWRRTRMRDAFLQPTYLFVPYSGTFEEWVYSVHKKIKSGLTRDLPQNVNILSLERYGTSPDQILLRLENIFGPNEGMDEPAILDIDTLFADFEITNVEEMSLGGNALLEERSRLHWNSQSFPKDHEKAHPMARALQTSQVVLKPMEIRTFLLTVDKQSSSA